MPSVETTWSHYAIASLLSVSLLGFAAPLRADGYIEPGLAQTEQACVQARRFHGNTLGEYLKKRRAHQQLLRERLADLDRQRTVLESNLFWTEGAGGMISVALLSIRQTSDVVLEIHSILNPRGGGLMQKVASEAAQLTRTAIDVSGGDKGAGIRYFARNIGSVAEEYLANYAKTKGARGIGKLIDLTMRTDSMVQVLLAKKRAEREIDEISDANVALRNAIQQVDEAANQVKVQLAKQTKLVELANGLQVAITSECGRSTNWANLEGDLEQDWGDGRGRDTQRSKRGLQQDRLKERLREVRNSYGSERSQIAADLERAGNRMASALVRENQSRQSLAGLGGNANNFSQNKVSNSGAAAPSCQRAPPACQEAASRATRKIERLSAERTGGICDLFRVNGRQFEIRLEFNRLCLRASSGDSAQCKNEIRRQISALNQAIQDNLDGWRKAGCG